METISREEAAWLAGVLDGEGCFQVTTKGKGAPDRYRLLVDLTNTCPYMIQRISELYEKMDVVFYISWGQWRPSTSDTEHLRIGVSGHGSIRKIIETVLPYLTTKKEQARLILDFIEWREKQPYGGPGARIPVALEYRKLRDKILALHKRRFSLQRLPRPSSTVLDLSNLELKV